MPSERWGQAGVGVASGQGSHPTRLLADGEPHRSAVEAEAEVGTLMGRPRARLIVPRGRVQVEIDDGGFSRGPQRSRVMHSH
jgi:hypothetical protein